ncbi:MAG: ketopantoate reductase family protein [Nitrospirae bacterium]|nr:ketopantoate reductase family protein [Candidatus Manganitrophaceae bacterium]
MGEDVLPQISKIQKVLVVGAGAVGGYFGALLIKSGVDLCFLVRENRFQVISENGLKIVSAEGDFVVQPTLLKSLDKIEAVDLIILAVKCQDLAPLLPQLVPLVEKGAVILTLQNGVGAEDDILNYYEKPCVLAGVAFITARLNQLGVVEHARRGMITLGELSGEQSPRAEAVHHLLSEAGIHCRLSTDIRRDKWKKLCWNATFNPLSVILDYPISLVLGHTELKEIVRKGIAEIIAVAASEGIFIKQKIIEQTIEASYDLKDYYTSMYEDYRQGKETEVEYLNGDLLRRGKKNGVPTPVNEMLYALVKGLQMKNRLKENLK